MRRAVSRIMPSKLRSFDQDHPSSNPATGPHLLRLQLNPQHRSNGDASQNQNFGSGSLSLSSPFKIDFNSVSDFYIILDNPHNSWLPGDEISGQIILITKKNLANIIITLSLIGFVKINASSHSKLRPIRHSLFNHTIKIYGEHPNSPNANPEQEFSNGLFKGEHRFPFIVKLPNKRIFTSIDFGKGAITYLLRASMGDYTSINHSAETPGSNNVTSQDSPSTNSTGFFSKTKNLRLLNNSNYTTEKLINLINPIDVNTLPTPKPKRLIIKDPRYNSRKLSRTQSSNSTINTFNTFSTFSSNNSDSSQNSNQPQPQNQTQTPIQEGEEVQAMSTEPQSNDHVHNHLMTSNPDSTPNTPVNMEDDVSSNHKDNYFNNSSIHPSSLSYDTAKPETIKVSLTIPKKGYLRGEQIPIKLNINHLRKVQDVNGIIVTFVRVCRLDNGPEGLYDSFRKDLAQSVIPLYVDPNTFTSEINTNIRIPADSFPTISGCPMVSFQYFVEVLVNLSGKTVVLDDNSSNSKNDNGHQSPLIDFPTPNGNSNNGQNNELDTNGKNGSDSLNDFKLHFNYLSSVTDFNQKERSTFINTDKYKRMKKFLQLTSEIIIGTHRLSTEDNLMAMDIQNLNSPPSRRSSGSEISPGGLNGSTSYTSLSQFANGSQPQPLQPHSNSQPETSPGGQIELIPESSEINNFNSVPSYSGLGVSNGSVPAYNDANNGPDLLPMPNQPEMSEKERLRAHESSLLPSEPGMPSEPVPSEPMGMEDNESRDSISPIGNPNDILGNEEQGQSNTRDQDQKQNQSQDPSQPLFNFFIPNDTPGTNNMDLNDDQYNNLDYVPNYEGSSNDALLHHEANNNQNQGQN